MGTVGTHHALFFRTLFLFNGLFHLGNCNYDFMQGTDYDLNYTAGSHQFTDFSCVMELFTISHIYSVLH